VQIPVSAIFISAKNRKSAVFVQPLYRITAIFQKSVCTCREKLSPNLLATFFKIPFHQQELQTKAPLLCKIYGRHSGRPKTSVCSPMTAPFSSRRNRFVIA
jgi:hypothetical protein